MTPATDRSSARASVAPPASEESSGGAARPGGPTWAWLIAAAGMALAALALLGMAAASLIAAMRGSASTTTRAVTEAIMLIVLAAGVGLIVISLVRRRSLAKTPTLLWNVLLVPVAWSLITGGAPAIGVAVLVVAVVTFVAALLIPRYDVDEEPPTL